MFARTLAVAGAVALLLASCAPRRPAPAPTPPPPPPAAPQPEPPGPAPALGWEDSPLSAGDWAYAMDGAAAVASFGPPGAPVLALRCEPGRSVTLARLRLPAAPAAAMTIRTSFGERRLAAAAQAADAVAATVVASDALLDEIAFSRGKFAVEVDGAPRLVLPTWPEPARVVEDCRG